MPPLSALEDELRLGGGWEKGEEVEPGAGLRHCHLASRVSYSSVLQSFFLLCL